MASKKKALAGFANLGFFKVTTNDTTGYAVEGTRSSLIGARSCSYTDNKNTDPIPGDDGLYDNANDWTDTDLTITVNKMSLENLAAITGADYDDETGELKEGIYDVAPEIAITFSALMRDGGYRLYQYYAAKCNGHNVSHTTKGDGNSVQTYELSFNCAGRAYDGKVRDTKDVEKGSALTWLDSIPSQPTQPDEDQSEQS